MIKPKNSYSKIPISIPIFFTMCAIILAEWTKLKKEEAQKSKYLTKPNKQYKDSVFVDIFYRAGITRRNVEDCHYQILVKTSTPEFFVLCINALPS